MECHVSPVKGKAFHIRSNDKGKRYKFHTKKTAGAERAKMIKYMEAVPGMKVILDS